MFCEPRDITVYRNCVAFLFFFLTCNFWPTSLPENGVVSDTGGTNHDSSLINFDYLEY